MIRTVFACVAAVTALGRAANVDEYDVDDKGFIRDWLILAPILCETENNGAEEIDLKQIKDEEKLRPKEGDKIAVRGKQLVWRKIRTSKHFIDFREYAKEEEGEDAVGYAVAYVISPEDFNGLKLKLGTNDQGKVYLNGKEVFKFTETRVLEEDNDTVRDVSLNKGENVLIFKVINEKNNWQCCLRFTDKDDNPLRSLKIALAPR